MESKKLFLSKLSDKLWVMREILKGRPYVIDKKEEIETLDYARNIVINLMLKEEANDNRE